MACSSFAAGPGPGRGGMASLTRSIRSTLLLALVWNPKALAVTKWCEGFHDDRNWNRRVLRVGMVLNAGFGFRLATLNGALVAAQRLNATVVFDYKALYATRATYEIDVKTADELFYLRHKLPELQNVEDQLRASPEKECGLRFVYAGSLNYTNPEGHVSIVTDKQWAKVGGKNLEEMLVRRRPNLEEDVVEVYDLGTLNKVDAPFLSTDFSTTDSFFHSALVESARAGNAVVLGLHMLRADCVNIVVHLRSGDRAPQQVYAKNSHLNLADDYYEAVVSTVLDALEVNQLRLVKSKQRPFFKAHLVVIGHNMQAVSHGVLMNGTGLPTSLADFNKRETRLSSVEVSIDSDWRSDLAHFAAADVFVASLSGFTNAAIAGSHGVVIAPRGVATFSPEHSRCIHVVDSTFRRKTPTNHRRTTASSSPLGLLPGVIAASLTDPACDNRDSRREFGGIIQKRKYKK